MKVFYKGSTYELEGLTYDEDNDLLLGGSKADSSEVRLVINSGDVEAVEINANNVSVAHIHFGDAYVSVTCLAVGDYEYEPASYDSPGDTSFTCNAIDILDVQYIDESEHDYDVELDDSIVTQLLNVFSY